MNSISRQDERSISKLVMHNLRECDLELGIILNYLGFDSMGELMEELECADSKAYKYAKNRGNLAKLKQELPESIESILNLLGYTITFTTYDVELTKLDLKDRIRAVIKASYASYLEDIKLIAFIENKYTVFDKIGYNDDVKCYTMNEVCELVESLDFVEFNASGLEVVQ